MLKPDAVHDGLAVYGVGASEPILVMAYPHATSLISDPARCRSCGNSSLWAALVFPSRGVQVLTDAPTTRNSQVIRAI